MITTPHRPLLLSLLLGFLCVLPARAWEWKMDYGLHDMVVPDVESHTLGIFARFGLQHVTRSGVAIDFDYELFLDHDQDELDPDHIPVWWISTTRFSGNLTRLSPGTTLSWGGNLIGKRNTVSSVEKQFKVFPDLTLEHRQGGWITGLRAGLGYHLLEIDDDVPRSLGFTRDDLSRQDLAFMLAVESTVALNETWTAGVRAQVWTSGSEWLEWQAGVEIGFGLGRKSRLVLSADFTRYNLAPYAQGLTPILPWDDDLLFRLGYKRLW